MYDITIVYPHVYAMPIPLHISDGGGGGGGYVRDATPVLPLHRPEFFANGVS